MARLYPPSIQNCSFFEHFISIPITHNIAVSLSQFRSYALIIKNSVTNTIVETCEVDKEEGNNSIITFHLTKQYNIGQYYKIQVAYVDNEDLIGYYSSIAIARYTEKIDNYMLIPSEINSNDFQIEIERNDINDPPFQYELYIYKDDKLIKKSGIQYFNIKEEYNQEEKTERTEYTIKEFLDDSSSIDKTKQYYVNIENTEFYNDKDNKEYFAFRPSKTYPIQRDKKIKLKVRGVDKYDRKSLDEVFSTESEQEDHYLYLRKKFFKAKSTYNFGDYYFNPLAGGYKIKLKIRTINDLEAEKTIYYFPKDGELLKENLLCENNYEYGYVKITLENNNSQNGKYYLSRLSENSCEHLGVIEPGQTRYDFCVQQGILYTYAVGKEKYFLHQLPKNVDNGIDISLPNLYSGYAIKNIRVDYEDITLWDGEKLLRLKFNPQVSSYKTVRQEQKVETIGSKYPFIFTNENISYKEFPISAFIAIDMDSEGWFMSFEQDKRKRQSTSSEDAIIINNYKYPIRKPLMDSNNNLLFYQNNEDEMQWYYGDEDFGFYDLANDMKNERVYKNAILDWLNNGKPKLYRSPQEGIFIVQIMNVSMSPWDALGRKYHTVSMQAVEIAEVNHANLEKYKFLTYYNKNDLEKIENKNKVLQNNNEER